MTETTNNPEQPQADEPKAPAAPRRKLTLTEKLIDMRDSHVKALTLLRDREARLTLDLDRLRSDRQRREDELRRLNTTLPVEARIAPEAIRATTEQAEADRPPEPWHGNQPLGQAQ